MSKEAPNPSVVKQLGIMLMMMDKIKVYELDVCGDDYTDYWEYNKIAKLLHKQIAKINFPK